MISIATDNQIPEIEKYLLQYFSQKRFNLRHLPSEELIPQNLQDMDAVFVRSTLEVDEIFCSMPNLKFVGSATAGMNHLHLDSLHRHNIHWAHAPGCNSSSVTHYVMAVIAELIKQGLFNVRQTVGIIGYGNIGKKLYALLNDLNIPCLVHDPLLQEDHLAPLSEVLSCDLISIHAPATAAGPYPTLGLINATHKELLKNKILINSSRGGLVDEALPLELDSLIYVADVWLDEPKPNLQLIERAFIATPHIAGYSIEGKLNGSQIMASKCAEFFEQKSICQDIGLNLAPYPEDGRELIRDMHGFGFPINLFHRELDLIAISTQLKALTQESLAEGFKRMRVNHPSRHDFSVFDYSRLENIDEDMDLDFLSNLRNFN